MKQKTRHIAETRVLAQVNSCRICSGQSDIGLDFFSEIFGLHLSIAFHRGSTLSWGMNNRSVGSGRPHRRKQLLRKAHHFCRIIQNLTLDLWKLLQWHQSCRIIDLCVGGVPGLVMSARRNALPCATVVTELNIARSYTKISRTSGCYKYPS